MCFVKYIIDAGLTDVTMKLSFTLRDKNTKKTRLVEYLKSHFLMYKLMTAKLNSKIESIICEIGDGPAAVENKVLARNRCCC